MNNTSTTEGSLILSNDCANLIRRDPAIRFWTSISWYVYTCVITVHFCGIVGNVLCLMAFYQQVKLGEAYYNQLTVMISDTLANVSNILFQAAYVYLGIYTNSAVKSIQTSWTLLTILTQGYPTGQTIGTATLLILIFASIERCYAMYKPFEYAAISSMNKKKIPLLIGIVGYGIAACASFHSHFVWKVQWNEKNQIYIVFSDKAYESRLIVRILSFLLLVLRFSCLFIMVGLTVVISRKYRELHIKMLI